MVQCSNSLCEKETYGVGVHCPCKKYFFCDNDCYKTRTFRKEHKPFCTAKAELNKQREDDKKKEQRKSKRQKAAAKQPRVKGGKWGKTAEDTPPELDPVVAANLKEKRLKQTFHKAIFDKKENVVKAFKALQVLRPKWYLKGIVQRNEKGSRADPVIYETPQSGGIAASLPGLTPTGDRILNEEEHFEVEEIQLNLQEVEDPKVNEPKPFCYICSKKIGTKRKNFNCVGKLEDGSQCRDGAAHGDCLNFQWAKIDNDIMKQLRAAYMCPSHQKKTQDSEEDSDEEVVEGKKNQPKKKRNPILFNTKGVLFELMPEDKRSEPMTRFQIQKILTNYIKENKLDYTDESIKPKVKKVRPDAKLQEIFGEEEFDIRKTGSKKLDPFLRKTVQIQTKEATMPERPNPVTEQTQNQTIVEQSSQQGILDNSDAVSLNASFEPFPLQDACDDVTGSESPPFEKSPSYTYGDDYGPGDSSSDDENKEHRKRLESISQRRLEEIRNAIIESSNPVDRNPKRFMNHERSRKAVFQSPMLPREPKNAKKRPCQRDSSPEVEDSPPFSYQNDAVLSLSPRLPNSDDGDGSNSVSGRLETESSCQDSREIQPEECESMSPSDSRYELSVCEKCGTCLYVKGAVCKSYECDELAN